ncbi:hypothetical protein Ade02nite_34220 [Paractinoplanes deccanensis]|uniref:Uncharacterized protein n=1 Tax=Paractinoplanes deccanensis TaxID=113561 RepID=A0ABQ3Y478_9ACTN|nr:hypothetical protein [Actinoplanes deccanensis]GID74781.1 hypothetical protein Ade02nite_34220 [Actinoplanes deccanensis]
MDGSPPGGRGRDGTGGRPHGSRERRGLDLKAAEVSELPGPFRARMHEQEAKSAIDVVRDFPGFAVADAEDLDEAG